MSQLIGMNPAEVRDLSKLLDRKAGELESARDQLDRLVHSPGWFGSDATTLQSAWDSRDRPAIQAASDSLREAARKLLGDADEQETASSADGSGTGGSSGGANGSGGGANRSGGGWLDSLRDGAEWIGDRVEDGLDWVSDGVDWVGDRVSDGLGWLGDRVSDGADWLSDRYDDAAGFIAPRLEALKPAFGRFVQAHGVMGSQFVRIFTEGRIPQVSELAASGLLIAGTTVGMGMNVVTGEDHGLMAPGEPWAGQPQRETNPRFARPTTDMASLTNNTMDAYGATDDGSIRVEQVVGEDGVTRYIVSVPGTEGEIRSLDGWSHNANGHNWSANFWGMAQGNQATNSQAVIQAIQNSVPPGSEVLLTGHSQGGLIAANVAADPGIQSQYDVAGVVGYGAPMDCADIPAFGPNSVPVLDIQHGGPKYGPGDLVPKLDLGGLQEMPISPNVTHVNLPSRGGLNLGTNHAQSGYMTDMGNLSGSNADAVNGYVEQNGIDRFFATDGSNSTVYTVDFGG